MRAHRSLPLSGLAIGIRCGCEGHLLACIGIEDGSYFCSPGKLPGNILHLGRIFWNNIFLQRFIEKRSRIRWTAHWFLAWGCLLAAAVTFPLSFGWVRFETARDNQEIYNAFMFGIPVGSFHLGTVVAELTFNILDIAAVMVLIGVFFAFWRRGRDRDARSVQQFSNDLLPLILLFAISITGLFLTASTHLMHGLALCFPLATTRHHRDLHAALSAVRQVLPYLPASGATWS